MSMAALLPPLPPGPLEQEGEHVPLLTRPWATYSAFSCTWFSNIVCVYLIVQHIRNYTQPGYQVRACLSVCSPIWLVVAITSSICSNSNGCSAISAALSGLCLSTALAPGWHSCTEIGHCSLRHPVIGRCQQYSSHILYYVKDGYSMTAGFNHM